MYFVTVIPSYIYQQRHLIINALPYCFNRKTTKDYLLDYFIVVPKFRIHSFVPNQNYKHKESLGHGGSIIFLHVLMQIETRRLTFSRILYMWTQGIFFDHSHDPGN